MRGVLSMSHLWPGALVEDTFSGVFPVLIQDWDRAWLGSATGPSPRSAPCQVSLRRARLALYNCAVGELTTEVMEILRCRYRLEVSSVLALVGGYDIWAESWQLDTDRGLLVARVDRSISAETSSWLGDVLARGLGRCALRSADAYGRRNDRSCGRWRHGHGAAVR